MSDLTIRSPNGAWVNICSSEWKVMQEDGTWKQINPLDDLRVRHGSNDYWLQIDCDDGGDYCPPEELAKCWPGYSGNFDTTQFKIGGPTGYQLCDCDGNNCKTYTGHTPDYNVVGGRFRSTAPVVPDTVAYSLPVTLSGSEAQVTEMLVYAGTRSGHIEVSVLELDSSVRVRIYNDCVLLGDSSVSGDYFNVFFNTEPPEMKELDCGVEAPANNFLTVRVDAPTGARWHVKLGEANITQKSSFQRPAPCFGTFGPDLPCFVNEDGYYLQQESAVYENVHYVPTTGLVRIDLTVHGTKPLTLEVFYNGGRIATTTTNNSATLTKVAATLAFNHAVVGGDNFIIVRSTGPRGYSDWTYAMYCPNLHGSRLDLAPVMKVPANVPADILCQPLSQTLNPAFAVTGQGAPRTDIHFNMSGELAGDLAVEYFATDNVQFLFYQGTHPNEVFVAGTPSVVNGHGRFHFRFDPRKGSVIHAQVMGPCCPEWSMQLMGSIPPPIIDIFDAEIQRPAGGQSALLCFDVKLRNKTPKRVTFDWDITPLTALPSPEGNCLITEVIEQSPYCNIVATGVGRGGPYDNNTNIGYPQALQVSSSLHDPNCAVGGQYYVLETEIELPYTGTYTLVGTADDNLAVWLDCVQVFQGPRYGDAWRDTHRGTFSAEAGWQALSVMYQNVPNCTVGWMKLVILDTAGNVVFATNPNQVWRSKAGAISVEPPTQVPINYPADYNPVSGSGAVESCTDSTRVCVPICGSDLMGPDVQFQLNIKNIVNADLGRLSAIGTIKNGITRDCEQNTNIAVLDGGPDEYVNRGGRKMYVSKLSGNSGAVYVMDTTLNIQAGGVYTVYFFGLDTAELFIDCAQVARVSGANAAAKVRFVMNAGARKMYINYYTNPGNGRRTGYAAMVLVDSLNRIVYASNAADWRGRIVSEGSAPNCSQFPPTCEIFGNSVEQQSHTGASGNFTVGYGAIKVRSSLHSNSSQGSGTWSVQYKPQLPAGNYTLVWSCDDSGVAYINCTQIGRKTSNWRDTQRNAFTVTDGSKPTLVTIAYSNGGDVTWANWAILDAGGNAVSVSGPGLPGNSSASGNYLANIAGSPLGETYDPGRSRVGWMIHWGGSIWGTGTDYAWWSAENEIDIPADGTYYAVADADDSMGLYIDCTNRPTNGTPFVLSAGRVKVHVRCYNYKAKDANWFGFILYKADGTPVYTSRAAGWKAKRADLDFSGMS
jgi:hypothetical protein|uniref:PA14 domain-containing protein n=1 Tax=Myoviridae sp. ctshb19 TaxID=2825194 RepID=A0A8S5UH50_9CAUD|nr:MAG TPA: hypothetical protein [Myoviridae sp. ctshb19]